MPEYVKWEKRDTEKCWEIISRRGFTDGSRYVTKFTVIATVPKVDGDNHFTAKLIEASPDLLQACENLIVDIRQRLTQKEIDQRIKYAEDIIDKINGE